MKRILVAVACLAGVFDAAAQSDTMLSRFGIQADMSAGINLHTADFQRIDPRFPSCCATFTGGSGFGYSLGAAFTVDLASTLNEQPIRFGARMSWTDLSGALVEDEFTSFAISGNTFTKAISRHSIDAAFGVFGIEPFVSASPLPSLPLRMRVGALIGIPMSSTFSQREELIEPADVSFIDGERLRNVYEGDLPNTSTQMLATLALSWPLTSASGLEISPEMAVMANLMNLTSSLTWSASALRLGVSVRYAIPKPATPPAPPPPAPPPPPDPAVRVPTVVSRIEMPTRADTIVLPMLRRRELRRLYAVPSVMFFERNSTSPLSGETEREQVQQRVIDAVRTAMNDDPTARLTVIGSAAADEPFVLARERYAWAIRKLDVDISRISVKTENPPQPEDLPLLDEQRSVTFLINDRPAMLTSADATVQVSRTPASISFAHVLTCDTACSESVTAMLNGRPLEVIGKGPAYRVVIDTTMLSGSAATLELRSSASVGDVRSSDAAVRAVVEGIADESVEVRRLDGRQGEDLVTLSYFDFNSSSPRAVNQSQLDVVRAAVRNGSSVTLVASTDNIGTEESNRQLAQKRAQAVLTLLGVRSDRLSIRIDVTEDDANRSPMGRVSNRSVRASISR
jgi:hypothetical protein